MDSILILGSLPKDKERNQLYEAMRSVSLQYAGKVSTPIETAKFKGTEQERYERAFRKVREADLVVGEQSLPSTGQGMELREAAVQRKPIVVVAKAGQQSFWLGKGLQAGRRNHLLPRLGGAEAET